MQNIATLAKLVISSRISRIIDYPLNMPIAIFLSLTDECYSKCKTCNIWKIKQENPERIKNELKIDEWEKVLKNISNTYWISVTGGEPFLKKDLDIIVLNILKFNKPTFLSIATSGIYPKQISKTIEKIISSSLCAKTKLIVNVSVDNINEEYMNVRGVDAYQNVIKTVNLLHKLKAKKRDLIVGINLTLSKYNKDNLNSIHSEIFKSMKPDSFICELVSNKTSLDYSMAEYDSKEMLKSIDYIMNSNNQKPGIGSLISILRKKYYALVKKHLLFEKEILKCHSGYAFCFITANGELRLCSVRNDNLGRLREHNMNFRKIWFSQKNKSIRTIVKKEKCYCNDSGANYLNILTN